MPKPTPMWFYIVAIILLAIFTIAIVLAAVFSGLAAFPVDDSSSGSSIGQSVSTGSNNEESEVDNDNLLLNPYYLRDVYHGTLLVLTEDNKKLNSCFGKCYNRFFICPESDQREECEEEAMILRECPSPLLCIKECIEECNPKGSSYPTPGLVGERCVDFRNAKAICP